MGFEPTTLGLKVRYSDQLSYTPKSPAMDWSGSPRRFVVDRMKSTRDLFNCMRGTTSPAPGNMFLDNHAMESHSGPRLLVVCGSPSTRFRVHSPRQPIPFRFGMTSLDSSRPKVVHLSGGEDTFESIQHLGVLLVHLTAQRKRHVALCAVVPAPHDGIVVLVGVDRL